MMHSEASAGLEALHTLAGSPRMPVVFISHGSPMNAITPNEFSPHWAAFGQSFGDGPGARWPRPHLILCVSAHWVTRGWWLTGMAQPATLHDFGGFPKALFEQQYPAPGAPEVARELAGRLRAPQSGEPLAVDEDEWGYDHGSWSVLKFLFPHADVPVIQLSLDDKRPAAEHLALGRQLRALRERGVLIVGSGGVVHNLYALRRGAPAHQAHDWAVEFDRMVQDHIVHGRFQALAEFQQLGELARLAHPTHEHFLPLLHAAGATHAGEPFEFLNEGFQDASVSMRSVVWG